MIGEESSPPDAGSTMANGDAGGAGSQGGHGRLLSRVWQGGQVLASDFPLEDLDTWLARGDVLVWLDVTDPDESRLIELAWELGLDPRAVEDALAPGERTKFTRHQGHTFLTAYATSMEADGEDHRSRLRTAQVSAFVLPHALITVHGPDFAGDADLLERWNDDAELLSSGPSALLHGLLDLLVDGHFETAQAMDEAIEDLEDLMFADKVEVREIQRSLYRIRKELVELRRVVLPLREVVNGVIRLRATEPPTHESQVLDGWFADLYDHVLRVTEWTESLRDMVTTLFETNLSLQDARLNTVMKKLAGWAAIIAVPTAVTGWFGQNVPYPGFQDASGLLMSAGLIVGGSVGLYLVFRKFDWI